MCIRDRNIGAGLETRARRALLYGVLSSLMAGLLMGWAAFFHGDVLAGIFADDPAVIAAAWEYLKAYAIDCLLTSFLFCFVGFFNGCGQTLFVMAQGMVAVSYTHLALSAAIADKEPGTAGAELEDLAALTGKVHTDVEFAEYWSWTDLDTLARLTLAPEPPCIPDLSREELVELVEIIQHLSLIHI